MKRHLVVYQWIHVLALSLCLWLLLNAEPCPNSCNGHGRCTLPNRECECFDQYTGADCSLRVCPYGTAWVEIATGTDDAHGLVECSNMGICDQSTGTCICRDGFEGNACERLSCPSQCNGVGQCQSLSYYASTKDPGYGTVYVYDDIWDANKIYGCNCDRGYNGTDCSLRICPTGDDPLTGGAITGSSNPAQYNEIQQVACKATGGKFTLTFSGETTSLISFNAKAAEIQEKLEALPILGENSVKVTFTTTAQACTSAGSVWTVEFLQNFGALPLLQGNSKYLTKAGSVASVVLAISHLIVGDKENLLCSNRGICDTGNGICECSTNFQSSNGYNEEGSRGDCGYESVFTQECPGLISCSGHGYCSDNPLYKCQCSTGWTGADCSEKLCPYGISWFTYPESDNTAHLTTTTECSSVGLCDRSTGKCACQAGFTGASCDRLSCPSSSTIQDGDVSSSTATCSNHGLCHDISTLATLATINGNLAGYTYGTVPDNPLTWDYDKIYGCYCDDGYYGYDCSLKSCPTGTNPDAPSQVDEIQMITCTASNTTLSNSQIQLSFRQQYTSLLSIDTTTSDLKTQLETLSSIGTVSVQLLNSTAEDKLCTEDGNAFLVTFLTNHGDLPMLGYDVQNVTSFDIQEIQIGTKENLVCSGRGLCDPSTGLCSCFVGYGSSDGQGNAGSLGDCGYVEPIAPIDST